MSLKLTLRIKKVEIDPLFFAVVSIFCFFNGVIFVFTVLTAAAIHELGHFAALKLFKAEVLKVLIIPSGFRIEFENRGLSYLKETAVSLAGPLLNLISAVLLILFSGSLGGGAYYNLFLASHILLALFNLLPVMPLDGGRALYSFMLNFCSLEVSGLISNIVSLLATVVIFIFGIWLMVITDYNLSLLLIAVFLLIHMIKGLLCSEGAEHEAI